MNDITDEKLKGMKLQVTQEMPPEQRKEIYALIKRRADMVTAELLEMKAKNQRPTISYLKQTYCISGKALHIKLHKIFGDDLPPATHKAKRKSKSPTQPSPVEQPTQPEKAIADYAGPRLVDIKRLKRLNTEKTIEWLRRVAIGDFETSILTAEQAQWIVDNDNEQED